MRLPWGREGDEVEGVEGEKTFYIFVVNENKFGLAVATKTTEKQNPVNISAKPATCVPLHFLPKRV